MTLQMIPLYILGGIFALYTAKQAFLWIKYETKTELPPLDVSDLIRNISPTETPFIKRMRSLNHETRTLNNE